MLFVINKPSVIALKKEVEDLGYFVSFSTSNQKKDQLQQMHIFKDAEFKKQVANVSLILACRINMMFNGVGREQKKLLNTLVEFSTI